MKSVWMGGRRRSAGFTGVDLVVALSVTLVVSVIAVPLALHTIASARGRHAAAYLAAAIRLARTEAFTSRRPTAVVFDRSSGRWVFRLCRDGNGNGVRRAEISSGVDRCPAQGDDLSQRFPGASIRVDPTIPGPDGTLPSAQPVRFGTSDMASCNPGGGCTPGTVFVASAGGEQFAVRLGSMTGRTRVLRFNRASSLWTTE